MHFKGHVYSLRRLVYVCASWRLGDSLRSCPRHGVLVGFRCIHQASWPYASGYSPASTSHLLTEALGLQMDVRLHPAGHRFLRFRLTFMFMQQTFIHWAISPALFMCLLWLCLHWPNRLDKHKQLKGRRIWIKTSGVLVHVCLPPCSWECLGVCDRGESSPCSGEEGLGRKEAESRRQEGARGKRPWKIPLPATYFL